MPFKTIFNVCILYFVIYSVVCISHDQTNPIYAMFHIKITYLEIFHGLGMFSAPSFRLVPRIF